MSAEIYRDLEMQKLIQDIETELARRHNWAAQEQFWQNETRLSRARNYIALAAIVATVTAASMGVLGLVFVRLLP
jgi:hypothetical protein